MVPLERYGNKEHMPNMNAQSVTVTRAPRGTDRSPEYNKQLEKASH